MKDQKAITLVALIITVIVLLILATVSISLVINSGIITKTKSAVDKYSEEEIGEQIKLSYSEYQMEKFLNSSKSLNDFIKEKIENLYPGSIVDCKGSILIEVNIDLNNNKYEYLLNNEGNVLNQKDIEFTDFTLTEDNYEMAGIIREGDVKIPSVLFYEGTYYRIVVIGKNAFKGCKKIGKVEIPDSVTRIENAAFSGSSITEIGITKNITNLGVSAFNGCTNLKEANFPNVVNIGNNAFWYAYISSYNFPNAETIGRGAFSYAWGISSVILEKRATLENKNTFRNGIIIYVNDNDLEWYSTEANWKDLYDAGKVKAVSELNES